MRIRVLDLIIMAALGKSLPDVIKIKIPNVTNTKWLLVRGYYHVDYYNGDISLGSLVAFNRDWLHAEVEFVEE